MKEDDRHQIFLGGLLVGDLETARRRVECGRAMILSYQPSFHLIQAVFIASTFAPHASLPFANLSQLPTPPSPVIPVHQFMPLSQLGSAIQSYHIAIHLLEPSPKNNLVAAIQYELALQLEKQGESGAASIEWQKAAKKLQFESVTVPKASSQVRELHIKRKACFRASITALCALERAIESNIRNCKWVYM